ncbi:MAG: hypothetical protein JWN60_1487 [Acidobacteria bacterium]|nr:hypothetical protein [Acidobacteriota bacterium]
MKRRKIVPISKNKLELLPTKRFLSRLKQLYQCEESITLSDSNTDDYKPSEYLKFKDSSEWFEEYQNLKEILSHRDHISSKK